MLHFSKFLTLKSCMIFHNIILVIIDLLQITCEIHNLLYNNRFDY